MPLSRASNPFLLIPSLYARVGRRYQAGPRLWVHPRTVTSRRRSHNIGPVLGVNVVHRRPPEPTAGASSQRWRPVWPNGLCHRPALRTGAGAVRMSRTGCSTESDRSAGAWICRSSPRQELACGSVNSLLSAVTSQSNGSGPPGRARTRGSRGHGGAGSSETRRFIRPGCRAAYR